MKIKTADLTGPALRYCVAKCEGYNVGVITAEEQWERFIEGSTPEELGKYAKEYAEIKAAFKDELCKIHKDGYKSAYDARAWNYDTDWAVAGPIVERENIGLEKHRLDGPYQWAACDWHPVVVQGYTCLERSKYVYGPTPLIAAMRCFVASRLGDEVDVPEELL